MVVVSLAMVWYVVYLCCAGVVCSCFVAVVVVVAVIGLHHYDTVCGYVMLTGHFVVVCSCTVSMVWWWTFCCGV